MIVLNEFLMDNLKYYNIFFIEDIKKEKRNLLKKNKMFGRYKFISNLNNILI